MIAINLSMSEIYALKKLDYNKTITFQRYKITYPK